MSTAGNIPAYIPQQVKPPKVHDPKPFDGTRSKLRPFISQCEIYIRMNPLSFGQEEQKVLWACSYLEGTAYDWITTKLKDYLDNDHDDREDDTNTIFDDHEEFVTQLTRMFGNIDEERRAERAIQTLRQNKSVTAYAGEFQLLAGKIDWDDKALTAQFYRGLKDEVKDDIVRGERPEELLPMINKAINIDSRLYERRLERKGQYSGGHHKKGKKYQQDGWSDRM